MKKILIPTDFSEYSDNAVDLGIQLAKKIHASIILIHIVEKPTAQTFNTIAMTGLTDMEKLYQEEVLEKGRKKLQSLFDKIKSQKVEIDTQLIICKPYDSISEIIAKTDADLIILGTKGSAGLNEIILGSNAEKVVRFASVPVITIHSNIQLDKLQKMIFATNLHINDQIAGTIINFQQLLGATIEFLWVHTPHVIENEEKVKEKLKKDIAKYGISNCNVHIRKNISVETGILAFATEMEADIILMATHKRQGLSHLLTGSYTEEIVNHSKKPVLTLSLNA